MYINKLRQHRQHKDDTFGVAGVDQKAFDEELPRADGTDCAQLYLRGRRIPIANAQPNQIGNAKVFDQRKSRLRSGQNGA